MFFLHRPNHQQVDTFLSAQSARGTSYEGVGATGGGRIPRGYRHFRFRVLVGHGEAAFHRARLGIDTWQMFDRRFLELAPSQPRIEPGVAVGIVIRRFRVWAINACQIVFRVDERDESSGETVARHGFAYGTLGDHIMRGEERFTVEHRLADDSVWYEINVFFRPRHAIAWLGYPWIRGIQREFVARSLQAMVDYVAEGRPADAARETLQSGQSGS